MKYIAIIMFSMFALGVCQAQTKRLIYEDGSTAGIVAESALKVSIDNLLNIPTTNRILYSNGTNLVSSANFTWNGSTLNVTGTGAFTGTVSGANAASAGQFTTLSQLQGAVSGTSGFYAKFTGVNTVGNGLLQDVSTTHLKTSGKPFLNEYSSTTNVYRDLHIYDNNTASLTGAIVIETSIGTGTNTMVTYDLSGYNYLSSGENAAWYVKIGVYHSANANYYSNVDIQGSPPFDIVQLGYNATSTKYVIILGTVSTVWSYPKIYVDKLTCGYTSASNTYATGWSSSLVTSLAAYTNIATPNRRKRLKGYGVGTYTGTNAKSLNVTSTGDIAEGMPMPTTALTVNQIPYSNGTTFTGGTGLTYTGSTFGVIGKGAFSGTVSMANGTLSGHGVNLSQLQSAITGTNDTYGKFTGTNSIGNAFLKDDVNGTYFESSAIERFRLHTDGRVNVGGITNRYSKFNVLGGVNADSLKSNNYTSLNGPTYFNYAPNFTPYQDGTDRIYVMKGDGELRSKELRDLLNDISANDTFALTGTTGGVFSLSSAATTTVDLGVYTNSISTNSVIEFRLVSGNPFYDNQQITVMSSKNMTCGQGVKIRLADSGGTSLVQLCNDILSLLTEEYEFASNPLQKFTLTFQYSKKRNKWRIVNFKEWGDL